MKIDKAPIPLILPNPQDPRLTERVAGTDQAGAAVEINVPVERPLTLYLNAQEIVTMMTIGDYPEYLALGYLLNQNMLKYDDVVTEVEYDDDLQVVVVRTEHHTNFEAKLKKRTQTSGCAQGTAFGGPMINSATKQSTSCRISRLLRGACRRARIRATRWLATTAVFR